MEFNERNYQKNLYNKIRQLYKNEKYENVIEQANKFLNKYEDSNIRFMRAKSYRYLGKFKEAIIDLKYNLYLGYNQHSITELFYIYYFLNMYKEALELLPTLYEKKCITPYSLAIAELVMKKSLGYDLKLKKEARCDYIRSQIIDYSEKEFLKHLENHLYNSSEDFSKFNKNINIDYLYNIVKQNINNKNKVNTEEILEIHYFDVFNIGYESNGNMCNNIKVVVIPNTKNIITMYPVSTVLNNSSKVLDCDYSYLIKKQAQENSQILKFKKKYKI